MDLNSVAVQLAEFAGWPVWYARNILKWRKARGYEWRVFGDSRSVS